MTERVAQRKGWQVDQHLKEKGTGGTGASVPHIKYVEFATLSENTWCTWVTSQVL